MEHLTSREEKRFGFSGLHPKWLPVPLLFAIMLLLWAVDLRETYLYPTLNRVLYFFFSTLASALVAYLVGRSFRYQGAPALLLIGCGVVIWGSAGLIFNLPTLNQEIAFFNTCVLLSALCHFSGALISLRPRRAVRAAGAWLGAAYTGSFCAVLFVRMAASEDWLPTFFIQGEGGTPLRHIVLGSAMAMFVVTAFVLTATKRRSTQFQEWYAPAMVLIAAGVFGVMIQSHHSSLLGWTGRIAQCLGGAYMLVAALALVRESRAWGITVEAALEGQEATLKGVLNAVKESIWLFSPEAVVLDANETALKRFEKPHHEVVNKKVAELLPGPLAASRLARIAEVVKTKQMVEFEDERAGMIFHHSFYPMIDRLGVVTGIAAFSRDITQKKRADEELLRTKNELEQKVKERTAELDNFVKQLQAANTELDARAEKLKALAGELTMSEQRERKRLAKTLHDGLQQYLVAAKLQVGSLVDASASSADGKTAKEIEDLLADAIAVSRSLAAELSPPVLHDSGLLSGLEWLSRWMLEKHGLQVELQMQMNAPALADDVKILLFESVRELLLNAVKHAATMTVIVRLEQAGNRLAITVRDEGKGFDPATIRSGVKSFGLFSIAERISLIGGNFEMDSAPGKGARFTLTAPLLLAGTPPAAKVRARPDAITPPNVSGNGRARILLADDHAVMREGLARLLSSEPDFEVIGQANDGHEAVEMAGKLNPDVILMDVSMPSLNGIDAARIIHQQHPEIRIIGLSLYQEEERAKEMLEAGAAFYLSKSGPPADLRAAIRACVQDRDRIPTPQPISPKPN